MFLTRMQINPRRRGARKLIGSPNAMHAAVSAGFPEERPSQDGRILWRLDIHGSHRVLLFVASPDQPDFTHIAEQAGWPATETWATQPYGPLLDNLKIGQHWQFRLTANPVHSGRRDDWTDTKPLGHVTVKQQEQWLVDRAAKHGFTLDVGHPADEAAEPDLAVIERSVRRFRRNTDVVTLATATFEGQLQIADPALLRRALTHGIGRGKAYGCGLLTLARPPHPRS